MWKDRTRKQRKIDQKTRKLDVNNLTWRYEEIDRKNRKRGLSKQIF